MIVCAPGKVVLWGEYAVLAGAPAAVMAVDRYAKISLNAIDRGWRFTSRGFLTPGVDKSTADFCQAPAALMVETALRHLHYNQYPQPFTLVSDSAAFYHAGRKLGLGSSAAVCCATYVALCELLGRQPQESEAIDIHRRFQQGAGSGLDVAASWHGGVIRFEDNHSQGWHWPDVLYWRVIWTGTPAVTAATLGDFRSWRESGDRAELNELKQISEQLFLQPDLNGLKAYTRALQALDESAQLNIFTPEHQRLATIASTHGLVYKPCGGGGGDIGLACGTDRAALDAFATAAADEAFIPLDLEIARHGVQAG